jgi:hypothetical protein
VTRLAGLWVRVKWLLVGVGLGLILPTLWGWWSAHRALTQR